MAQMKSSGLSGRVLKVMSIFSGVQIVQILCSIVRTKLVALWIGPVGVGLFAIYNSTLDVLSQLGIVGLDQSATREIAATRNTPGRLPALIHTVRRWAIWLAIAAAVATAACSPLLSRITFGDTSHTLSFVLLAIALFFKILYGGETPILQGLERFRQLASATMWGAVSGVALSIPLFYFLKVDSIIPAIIIFCAASTVAVFCYRRRSDTSDRPSASARTILRSGLPMLRLGLYLAAASTIAMGINFIFTAYMNRVAGTVETGFYQTGYTITGKYVSLIFSAIAIEYYPRLVSVIKMPHRTEMFVSHEIMLAMYVIAPVALMMITFDSLVIRILYSDSFMAASPLVTWGMVGTLFRIVTWCLSFVILAKGDGKLYIITEGCSALLSLGLNIAGYEIDGLRGLGISYTVWYFTAAIGLMLIYRYHYHLKPARGIVAMTLTAAGVAIVCIVVKSVTQSTGAALTGTIINVVLTCLVGIFCVRRLYIRIYRRH